MLPQPAGVANATMQQSREKRGRVQFSTVFDRRAYYSEAIYKAQTASLGLFVALLVALVFQLATNGDRHSSIYPLSSSLWTTFFLFLVFWLYRVYYLVRMLATSEVRLRASNQKLSLIVTQFGETDITNVAVSSVVGYHLLERDAQPDKHANNNGRRSLRGRAQAAATASQNAQAGGAGNRGAQPVEVRMQTRAEEALRRSSFVAGIYQGAKVLLMYKQNNVHTSRPIPGVAECTQVLSYMRLPVSDTLLDTLQQLGLRQLGHDDISVDALRSQGRATGALPGAVSERRRLYPVAVAYWLSTFVGLVLTMQQPTDTEFRRLHHDALVVLYVMFLVATANLTLLSLVVLKPLARLLVKRHWLWGTVVGHSTYEESLEVLKGRVTSVVSWCKVSSVWNHAAPVVFVAFSFIWALALKRYLNTCVCLVLAAFSFLYRARCAPYLRHMSAYGQAVSDPVSSGVTEARQSLLHDRPDAITDDIDAYCEYMWVWTDVWEPMYIVAAEQEMVAGNPQHNVHQDEDDGAADEDDELGAVVLNTHTHTRSMTQDSDDEPLFRIEQ